jgi:riboflavin kinase/FMN adenylyltransferase
MSGAGRGKALGIPTLNIDLGAVPKNLQHGIYAGWIRYGGTQLQTAIYYGPRPVFQDSVAFEAHVLDSVIDTPPAAVDIEIVGRIRDVLDFPSTEALLARITTDIEETRGMLSQA